MQAAAGPGNALAYHAAYEFGGDVTKLPAGDVWLDTINETAPEERHLAVHDQHLVALNRADAAAWAAGSWKAIVQTTLTGTANEIGRRVSELAAEGVTEIIYQPTGPDITGDSRGLPRRGAYRRRRHFPYPPDITNVKGTS